MILVALALAGAAAGSVVIDRLAVVVGKHAIKLSDIDRDLRVTEFLNRQPLDLSTAARKKAADRLVDQELIAEEIANGGYQRPSDKDADALMAKLRTDKFGASDARLRQALAAYGITEDVLRAGLLWQLEVLRFIDQRFRPGVMVTEQEVRQYYDQHRAELAKQYPRTQSFEGLEPNIQQTLEGEEINKAFDDWLTRARQRTRIEYKQGAFQ